MICPECKDDLAKILREVHASLHAEMREHVFSLRGIALSSQMYTVERIAQQYGIFIESVRDDSIEVARKGEVEA